MRRRTVYVPVYVESIILNLGNLDDFEYVDPTESALFISSSSSSLNDTLRFDPPFGVRPFNLAVFFFILRRTRSTFPADA